MNLAETLAKNLKKRRGDETTRDFARKLKISKSTLSRLENVDQNVNLNTIQQITKSLNCSICDLFK